MSTPERLEYRAKNGGTTQQNAVVVLFLAFALKNACIWLFYKNNLLIDQVKWFLWIFFDFLWWILSTLPGLDHLDWVLAQRAKTHTSPTGKRKVTRPSEAKLHC
jgi:hypothetical protein